MGQNQSNKKHETEENVNKKIESEAIKETDSGEKENDSGVKETDSEVKEPDSEVKETDSEVKESDSVVKETDSEVKENDSEVKETDFEVKETDSVVKETDSEVKETDSEVKVTDFEVKETDSEVKETNSEVKETNSEVKETNSEVKETDSEVKETNSEVKETNSEVKETNSEVKEIDSEVKEIDSAIKETDSAIKETDSGVKENDPGVKNIDSGVKENESVIKNIDSVVKEMDSAEKEIGSGANDIESEVKKIDSGVKKIDSGLNGIEIEGTSQCTPHSQNLDVGEDLAVPDDFSVEELRTGMWWRHLVSGGVAGMVSRTCTAPLDRIKVFLQVHGLSKFKTLSECFRYMMKEGGWPSLWRGNGINVLKIAPESALKFAAYEQAKRVLAGKGPSSGEREISVYERFAAGSFAGGFSQTAIYPLEVLKTRLALRKTGQYKSIADAALKIYRLEGYRSFYRGYVPNLLGIIPYAGIDLCIYETLKKMYLRRHQQTSENPSILVITACGALSSSCGQIASYPLALVRTRLQAQVITPGVTHSMPVTMSGLFKHILSTEGVLGLYRGIAPNFLKVAPAVSISYVVYEKCRVSLGVSMT